MKRRRFSSDALAAGWGYIANGGDTSDSAFGTTVGVACLTGMISPASTVQNLVRNAIGSTIGGASSGSAVIEVDPDVEVTSE